jgi:hypothetical protein
MRLDARRYAGDKARECPATCGAFLFASISCRSELARDGLPDNAGIQTARVIVDVHREQARSYSKHRL